jgi:hypothetical protein
MKLLHYKDWKRRLPFDNIVYKDVKRYSLRLNTYERELMDIQIEYYRNNFSLLQVMNHFKTLKTKEEIEDFIKSVLKRQDGLLYIPNCLKTFFKKKINDEFSTYKAFFEILLTKCLEKKPENTYLPVAKAILGDYYKPVMKYVNRYSKMKLIKTIQKKVPTAGYENMARDIIYRCQSDFTLSSIFGRSSFRRNLPISVVDDFGYGEWISKQVTYNNNRLFLYSNHNTLTDVQIEHMVYFNVYPGYGHFYTTILEDNNKISFDNGATYLINGWAMYAMCHSESSAYAMSMMSEGSVIMKKLLSKKLDKAYEDIYVYLLGLYPKQKVMSYIINYTQFPGHYMSYILGGFATDLVIKNGFANTPIDYLNSLRTINCGDFFALYSPKMQKKIADTNITAKVVQRFND